MGEVSRFGHVTPDLKHDTDQPTVRSAGLCYMLRVVCFENYLDLVVEIILSITPYFLASSADM